MSNPPDIFRTSLPSAFDASLGERRMRALPARSVPTASTYSSSSLVSALPLPNNTYPNSLGMVRSSTSMDLVPSGNGSFQSASSLSFEASPQPPGSLEWSVGAKRDADDGRETKPERPTKKRRGLTGVLVDGAVTASIVAGAAVFGAYSLWQSWGRKPQEVYEHPSLIEDACTDFLPNTSMRGTSQFGTPAASPSPMAASPQRPGHAVYISSRRRRTIIPSQRRRLPPSRSTPQKPRTSMRSPPHASSPAPTDYTLSPALSQINSDDPRAPPTDHHDDQSGSEEEDAAFTRMQDQLSAMIVECNTALSSQAQPIAMESVLEEERRYAQSRASLSALNSPDQSRAHRLSPSPLGPTPQLYGSPIRDRPSRGPSRIPKPSSTPGKLAAAQPPSAPTFAFHMRPSRSPGPVAPSPRRSRHQRMASNVTTTSADGHRTPRALSPTLPNRSPLRSPRPTQPRAPWR